MIPTVSAVVESDVNTISLLAGSIWRQHYLGIISSQQIDYMLAQRYQPGLIIQQLTNSSICWRKLVLEEVIIGFSCYMRTTKPNELKIDKLYIHCDHHRKGYGAMLIADAKKIMQKNNLSSLILTVNRRNQSAIRAYQHYGFEIAGDSMVDIGEGLVMDDYLMTLSKL